MKRSQIYSFVVFGWVCLGWVITTSFAGCTRKEKVLAPPRADTVVVTGSGTPKKYMALGDSYTIGQSVPLAQRFPHQLADLLRARGIPMAVPEYIATTGWTTQSLLGAISSLNPPADFDMVTLLIGVNNQYQRRDTGEYRQQFLLCLQQAIRLARGRKERVFVVSIPDYAATPYGLNANPAQITKEINWFNDINRQVTLTAGVSYTDITPGSRDAVSDPSLVAPDGLHPSGKEYAKWAAALAPKVEVVLK